MHDSTNIETAHRLFSTTPDTVYGILVFCLAAAVVALWIALVWQSRYFVGRLLELNGSNVEALKVMGSNLDRLRDAFNNLVNDLMNENKHSREHIAEKIDNIKSLLRYENKQTEHEKRTHSGAKGAPPAS